jgi:hypothetical protein
MPFKGGVRQYSNRYHFTGGTPADSTHWHTLFDNVTTAEKAIHGSTVTIVEALGYAAGSDVAVDSKVYSLAGTNTGDGASVNIPGECAALVRWSTSARSSKNHPIYLYSYYHHVAGGNTSATCDKLDTVLKSSMATYASSWITGFSDGAITCKRASPSGHVAVGSIVEEYVTHRDFPYTTSV